MAKNIYDEYDDHPLPGMRAERPPAPTPIDFANRQAEPPPSLDELGLSLPQGGDSGAVGRIGQAAAEGWRGGTMQTPEARARNDETLLGQFLINPLVEFGNLPFRAIGAFGAGVGQAAYETGESLGRALPEVSIPQITLSGDRSITYPGGITVDRPGRGLGGTVLGGPGLGRDFFMLNQLAPAFAMPGSVHPRLPEAPPGAPPGGRFVSERVAPPRQPGMTDAERIQQLVEHGVNEEQPTVGPPMARGPMTVELPQAPTPEMRASQPAASAPAEPPARGPISKSGDAFKVSDAFYDTFDQAAKDGGSLTPNVANKVVDKVESYLPPPGMAEAFGAGDELKGIVAKLQQYRDKPMSLLDVNAVDQQIGDLIHRERDPIKGMSPYGRKLQEIQDDLRGITEKPAASDVVGGQAGLDALAPARQAYSQAKKMQELERLWEKAQGKQNPTTSYQTSITNLFDNKRRSAGFTDEEEATVKDAAAHGVVGGGVHLLGSRLIPIAAGAAELGTHGLTAGTAAALTAYFGGTGMRALENRLATRRFESAQTFLGQRVPHLPNQLGPFAPP